MRHHILFILILPFLLISCSGARKTKTIVELSPRLHVQANEKIVIDDNSLENFNQAAIKSKIYSIGNNKIISEPVCKKDVIFTIDSRGNISAFSVKEKKILWTSNVSTNIYESFIGGGILYHKERLYVTYGARYVVVLDSKSGHEIIRKMLPDILRIAPVAIDDNTIMVQTVSNQIFTLNTDALGVVWQHEGNIEILSSTYHTSPIIYHNLAIINYTSGAMIAFNASDGQVIWFQDLSKRQEIMLPNFEPSSLACKPVFNKLHIYVATSAGKILKIDMRTGAILWEAAAEDVQSISLYGNNLFITNNACQVAAINIESGLVVFVADFVNKRGKSFDKPPAFLPPIIAKSASSWSLDVISGKGELFSFQADNNGNLTTTPLISRIANNIQFYGKTCSGDVYYLTDKGIIFRDITK